MICHSCKKPLKINQAEIDRGYINPARLYCDAVCGKKAYLEKKKQKNKG